ncbi:MAG TPA: hypothetical protein VEV83_04920 [Parafilimonas sp.]|nr:hypothetical protein [Parafilimonas sp.]
MKFELSEHNDARNKTHNNKVAELSLMSMSSLQQLLQPLSQQFYRWQSLTTVET